ncbi:MAG: ABC transporter ATP-binding protein [Gemmatimonadales bacterium]
MSEPLLAVLGLTKHYERGMVHALAGVSFEAQAGEVVAVTGPSGCGKSTLLSLIGLLDRPTEGRVRVAGDDLTRVRKPSAFRARRIGFVFQFHHLVPTMTLLENVGAPMVALGAGRARRRERAQELLDRMGLAARADFLPTNVSGGERQRAAVARALVNRPQVILADEPTGNLDTMNGEIVLDLLMTEARAQGALVLMATHNPELVRKADREIALRDGRLAAP